MTKKTQAGNKRERQSRPKTQKRVELLRPQGLSHREERQKRKPSAIITPEEFTYVKRDLMTIAVLSSIMVAAMVVLAFILGIG